MHEPLKPLVGTVLTRKSSEDRLSQHGVEIPGSQTYMGAAEIKQKHSLLHGGNAVSERGSGPLLRFNHCFTKTPRSCICYVCNKEQSLTGNITIEYEFMNSGEKEMTF